MTTYCIKPTGNDSANGLTDVTAWASIAKVKSALAAGLIKRGDTIRFRRGGTYYGRLADSIPDTADSASPLLTIGAYGPGSAPVLSGFKVAVAAGWVQHSATVYKLDITAGSGKYTGDTINASTNAGHLRVNGVAVGARKFALANLAAKWDFYCDSQYIYVRSDSNPSTANLVEIATEGTLYSPKTSTMMTGVCLEGSGSHAVDNASVSNVHVIGCEIGFCGGSVLTGFGDGTVRYGNGIQTWIGCSDWVIENNLIHDIFEGATTPQGTQANGVVGWRSIHYRFNLIWNCGWGFEFFANGSDTTSTGAGFIDVSFTDNIVINSGFSWGQAVRPDPDGRGTALLIYQNPLPVDVTIKRNLVLGAFSNYLFALNGIPTGLKMDDNQVFLAPGTKVCWQDGQTIEQGASWAVAKGVDSRSVFETLPRTALNGTDALSLLRAHAGAANAQARILERSIVHLSEMRGRITEAVNNAAPAHNVIPAYSGYWYSPPGSNLGTLAFSNGGLSGVPLTFGRSATLDGLAVEVTAAGSTGALIRIGAYILKSDGSFQLLVDAGTLAAATTGVKQVSGLGVKVPAGTVVVPMVVTQGAPSTTPTLRTLSGSNHAIGLQSAAVMLANQGVGYGLAGVTGAFPSAITPDFNGGQAARVVVNTI